MDTSETYRILLIERDAAEAHATRAALAETTGWAFTVEWVQDLCAGIARLNAEPIDAVLLDLFLPDCQGLATFEQLRQGVPHVPVFIICDPCDESLAMEAVERGAQDYLLKTRFHSVSLGHALRNMIEHAATAEALSIEKDRANTTLDSIGDAVISTDMAGRITYLNVVAERLTGWSRQDAEGRPFTEVFQIVDGATRERASNPLTVAVQENRTVGLTANCVLIRRDASEMPIEDLTAPIHDRRGLVTGAVIVFHESVTRAGSSAMSHSAFHDALTDLPNRQLLNDRLVCTIELARRYRRQLAVLCVDVDRFQRINDSLGHEIGDQLLKSVAEQLTRCLRCSDTVSRQGGDEFMILLSEIDQASHAIVTVRKIIAALAEPHHIAGHELHMTTSMGVSLYPDDGHDAETLLRNADSAMYRAKERGHGHYQFFQADMNCLAVERESLEDGLRRALERHEFILHYQPKIDLETGMMLGAEALIRWRHPNRGLLTPNEFVPIAEDSGLIVPIGRWVLREACRQAREWQDAGLRPMPVAVNVSAVEFRSPGFLEHIRLSLEETRLESRHLELELTESVLMAHAEAPVALLRGLKDMGLQLALDDFGTGYSSLSYLKEFPIDALKVDQSFVRGISDDLRGAPIVVAIISMGKSLNHRVIAEGVETAEQLAFLQAQGCGEGQGFFFSRPLPAEQFASLLLASERAC